MRAPNLHRRYPDYEPQPTPVAPKWDALRYDRLPDDDPELEHVARDEDRTFQHWSTPEALWYLLLFSLGALAFSQAARLLGAFLLVDSLTPVWTFATVAIPVRDYLRHRDGKRAGLLLLGIPLAFLALRFASAATGPGSGHLFCLFLALLSTAVLVDALADHAVALALGRAPLPRGQKARLRACWDHRFQMRLLGRELGALRKMTDTAPSERRPEDEKFLEVLITYQWGFGVLFAVWFLALVPHAQPLLLVFPPAFALYWVATRSTPHALRAAATTVSAATESWVRYGAHAEDAPGLLRSPAGARLVRLGLTAATLGLSAAALVPTTIDFRVVPGLVFGNTTAVLWNVVLEGLGAWLLPLVVLGSTAVATLGTVLPALQAIVERTPPEEDEARRWDAIVETLRTSDNPRVRRQLFVGFHAVADYPVLLPIETLREHAHILGATGSGKTSRAMLPLIAQLLRVGPERRDAAGAMPLRGSVLVIDLKGDAAAFHTVRLEAERNQRPFKFLSNVTGLSTFAFNPLLDLAHAGLTRVQIGETLRGAFNLEHGTGYGKGHFSAASRGLLADLIERVSTLESFEALYRESQRPRVRTPVEKERERESTELLSTLKLLAERPELNVTEARPIRPDVFAGRIDMVDAVLEGGVIYFHLQATAEEALVRYIASLALACFHTAVSRLNLTAAMPDKKPAYAFIDEFQVVAGRNVGLFMQQARSSGLALILTNQAREDLPEEVRGAIEQNTAYRQYFTFRTPEALRYMEALSGRTEEVHVQAAADAADFATFAPRLSVNDLTAISADDALSVVVQATARDYAQFEGRPMVMRSPRHLTRGERDALEATLWPQDSRTLPLVSEREPAGAPPAGSRAESRSASTAGAEVGARLDRIRVTEDGYEVAPA